jgi:hypothetical protein
MKFLLIALISILSLSSAFAGEKRKPASSGNCSAAALGVAEDEYGNDPMRTDITSRPNQFYVVTVGIGNPEDGAHTYLVKCQGPQAVNCGCTLDHEILPKGSK